MNAPPPKPAPVTVFYSYAHEDEALLADLRDHLKILEWRGLLAPWHDRRIVAGGDWDRDIDEHLRRAELVLLLLSKDFFGSDYIFGTELAVAMRRHQEEAATVVPIVVRAVDLDPEDADALPFLKLQALPTDMRPVTSWPNRDEAWTDVARGLRRVVASIIERRPRDQAGSEQDDRDTGDTGSTGGAGAAGASAAGDGASAAGDGGDRAEPHAGGAVAPAARLRGGRVGGPHGGSVDKGKGSRTYAGIGGDAFAGGSADADGGDLVGRDGAVTCAASPAPASASDDPALARVIERFSASMSQASRLRGAESDPGVLREGAARLIDRDDVPRVLWVDDRPEGNAKEREALARVQVEVVAARSTAEAKALLEQEGDEPFDLVVSDWERSAEGPGAGLALLDWLRAHRPALPLVYYHGEFEAARRARRAAQARAHGAFGEAVLPDALLALVTSALGRGRDAGDTRPRGAAPRRPRRDAHRGPRGG